MSYEHFLSVETEPGASERGAVWYLADVPHLTRVVGWMKSLLIKAQPCGLPYGEITDEIGVCAVSFYDGLVSIGPTPMGRIQESYRRLASLHFRS